MESVRLAFMERLKNAETLVITDSLKRRKKYSSKWLENIIIYIYKLKIMFVFKISSVIQK